VNPRQTNLRSTSAEPGSANTTIISRSTVIDKPTDPQRPIAQLESANDQCFNQISTSEFDFSVESSDISIDEISTDEINIDDTEETASSNLRGIDDYFADL
jgi:hypothetical protein